MKHVYYVVVLVVRPQNEGFELLLAQRAREKYMGGTWQLISGGLEPDETAWQGALREMQEETQMTPKELYRLSTLTSFYRPDNDSLNTAPMFCALVDGNSQVTINDEHLAYRWIPIQEVEGHLMWPSDRQAVEEVCNVILNDDRSKQYLRIPLKR